MGWTSLKPGSGISTGWADPVMVSPIFNSAVVLMLVESQLFGAKDSEIELDHERTIGAVGEIVMLGFLTPEQATSTRVTESMLSSESPSNAAPSATHSSG